MRRLRIAAGIATLLLPAAATAAPATIQVVGADGRPLAGAVVSLTFPSVAAPVPRGTYTMAQRNIAFEPHVMIVPMGATVSFPNLDKVRHHVYSFSPPKKFELKLFGRDETRSITFDKPGAVALGCNIHDAMNGVIFVTATPYAAVTGADGQVRMTLAASGPATLSVWHPSIRAKDNILSQRATVTGAGLRTTLQIRR